ncbi:Chromatin structure-remodeling complex protein rsc9 [Cytospora paraplurivora]|uniref:Chromatin structure-remodeling complex protein rsc9 n=1 Tax=Cytospora paraplurivora TaxID=2898453 RepID=A0AAN9U7B9_9PEZI
MAPTDRVPEHFIDRTPEYEDFIAKLREFHTNRGTRFDPEPKINATHVDLYKLFNCVVEHGGYDKVSEKKLTWREILSKLGIYSHNPAAASFTLKTLYYKNLAAYEIRTVYNKTPPPPEILEDLSARGSGILTRTLEGFTPKNRRSSTAQNSPQPSGDDGTPARDSKPEDTPSSGRAARGLRQAPPQRVIFQPDTGPTRLPAQTSPFDGPNIYARCLYALRSGIPKEQAFALHHLLKISFERGDRYKFEGFPGLAEGLVEVALKVGNLFWDVNFRISYDPELDGEDIEELDGINGTADILERIEQLSRRSTQDHIQPAEFADQMVMVTEATLAIRNMLMLPENSKTMSEFPALKDLLCIILHLPQGENSVELKHIALDIAEQLTPCLVLDPDDPLYRTLLAQLKSVDRGQILTSLRALGRISMTLDETNKLGDVPLDILESIIDWLMLNDDELLDACLDFLYQYTAVVSNIETLLKFRSSKPDKPESLVKQLVRLLSHGGKRVVREFIIEPEARIPYSEEVAPLPQDLQERLLAMEEPERCYMWLRCLFEEDADASITQIAIWTAYQSSFSSRLSQMGKTMISPADFIRNVNHVWTSAGAQIIKGPNGANQKFIIKGIRARTRPVDPDDEGREYFRCLWTLPIGPGQKYQKCNNFFANAERMYEHILATHICVKPDEEGKYPNKEVEDRCLWAGCHKFAAGDKVPLGTLMAHVKTHLVAVQQNFAPGPAATHQTNGISDAASNGSGPSPSANPHKKAKRSHVVPAKLMALTYEETMTVRDERDPHGPPQPAGTPFSAVLVLRNIARNVVKTEAQEELLEEQERQQVDPKARGWNERLFRAVLPRLHEIMSENRVLAQPISTLLELIEYDFA